MLQLENVKKSYPQYGQEPLEILEIPSFKVAAAEQMVLVGRSGSGKTTMLHTIAGITKADSGKVVIDKVDMLRLSESGRDRLRANKIGYVFQTFNLLQSFTALENVLIGMTFSRGWSSRKRAEELLQRVGLGHRLHHKPDSLSVGEQQRVAVARALVKKPRLLLADEPTANVDPSNQELIIELLRETCREEKVAMILVTHSMEVSEQFDRVEKLEDINLVGKKTVKGETEAV
ncbi:MAG: ABC transporter ATP-binding protein [Pirellulaceae bacterium]|nr:ABC transporter ATP-binding protein [Pirellulaceae bacterium]